MKRCPSDGRGASRRAGVAFVEALVSLAIFVILVGSVAYASRIALTVMSESMKETRLLFRVRRALDHAEEQLSRSCRTSVVALTDDDWTVAGLGNWFEQLAHQNEGQPVSEPADEVRDDLEEAKRALERLPPDYATAEERLDHALETFDELVGGGLIDPGDAPRVRDALNQIRTSVFARAFVDLGGTGVGVPNAWQEIEQTILDRDSLVAAEPLVAADQVLFRQVVLGVGGLEYRPPLDEPPCSYYLRPMDDGEGLELVFFDGARSIVVADHLVDARFDVEGHTLRITLVFEEERTGVVIERTEVRSVQLRTL